MMTLRTDPVRGDDRSTLQLELERDLETPALARAAIVGFCESRGFSPSTLATLTLLVSEVVTNAVIHPDVEPPGTVGLYARLDEEGVRVEVRDRGQGFTPEPRDPNRLGGGYGLYLLEKEAASWGVEQGPQTTVWFEVATPAP
jgi:anti-sigma regulatory factor (Ser/Thr protein kinase)